MTPGARRLPLYVGTDVSRSALDALERRLGLSESHKNHISHHLPHVRFLEKEADDFEGLDAVFDTVILNSVAQYLPGVEYLLRVLSGAVAVLKPGGGRSLSATCGTCCCSTILAPRSSFIGRRSR